RHGVSCSTGTLRPSRLPSQDTTTEMSTGPPVWPRGRPIRLRLHFLLLWPLLHIGRPETAAEHEASPRWGDQNKGTIMNFLKSVTLALFGATLAIGGAAAQ